jgi:uncharacterized protein YkwD
MRAFRHTLALLFLLLPMTVNGCRESQAPNSTPLAPLVPSATAVPPAVARPPADSPLPTPPSTLETPVDGPRHPITHSVAPGDTLLGLAMQYQVPMAAIQLTNNMSDSLLLYAGDQLSIPEQSQWLGASPFWVLHIVRPGETISSISERFGVGQLDLLDSSQLQQGDAIAVGQSVVVPLAGPPPAGSGLEAGAHSPSETPAPGSDQRDPAIQVPRKGTETQSATPIPQIPTWPQQTAQIVNEVRAGYGLPPLLLNDTLAAAAQSHAQDCAQRGFCGHVATDGSNIRTRITEAGYDPGGWAECWAQQQSPQAAVDIWMDEVPPDDPHRRTLLSTWLTEIGVGVAQAGWGYYFVADFGRPH